MRLPVYEPITKGVLLALFSVAVASIGAAFFLILEHQLSSYTEAWALFLGLVFIAVVLFAPEGIWGLATSRVGRMRAGGGAEGSRHG